MIKKLIAIVLLCCVGSAALAQGTETFGNYVNGLTAGTAPGNSDKLYIYQGGNSRAVAPGAVSPLLIAGNVDVYANASTGSDSNDCLSSGAACATVQHAVFVATQNFRYGIGIGAASVHMAHGTFNEVVDVPGLTGLATWCATCANGGSFPNVLEFVGDDSSPGSVIVAAPSGACNRGGGTVRGGVITFPGYGTYWLHGFTVTAVNEASGNYCADLTINSGAYVVATGTMNYGTASNGAPILNLHEGGTYKQSFNSATMNVTAGTTRTGEFADISAQGKLYLDNSTVNFIGSTTFTSGYVYLLNIGAWVSSIETTTYTGTVSGICMAANSGATFENFNQGDLNETFAGCTPAAGTRGGFNNNIAGGSNIGGMIVSSLFGTNINGGSPPTVSGCGSGIGQVGDQTTDQSGHIVEGSGATGCTVIFYNTLPLRPNCTVTPYGAATLLTNFGINGSGSSWTGFTVGSSGPISFDYTCWHHY